jgi:putative ATPase
VVVEEGLFGLTASATSPEKRVRASAPLAVRMRPRSLDEVVGQTHLLRAGAPLRRLLEGGTAASVVLFGPPGTGKTTIAGLLASDESRHFVALSALSSGVKELREVIDNARQRRDRRDE